MNSVSAPAINPPASTVGPSEPSVTPVEPPITPVEPLATSPDQDYEMTTPATSPSNILAVADNNETEAATENARRPARGKKGKGRGRGRGARA